MLKKENRLKKRKEFGFIYKNGTRVFSKNITMVKIKSKYPIPRIGVSVSNKIGKAVVRNKIKRRMRAILFDYIKNIRNCNIIFVAQPNIVNITYQEMKNEIKYLLKKGSICEII